MNQMRYKICGCFISEKRGFDKCSEERPYKRQKSLRSGDQTLDNKYANKREKRSKEFSNDLKGGKTEKKKKKQKDLTGRSNFEKMKLMIKDNDASKKKNWRKKENNLGNASETKILGNGGKKLRNKVHREDGINKRSADRDRVRTDQRTGTHRHHLYFEDFPRGEAIDNVSVTFSKFNAARDVIVGDTSGYIDEFSGELFSTRSLKLRGDNGVNAAPEDLDLDHQVYNNHWWEKKQNKRRKRKRSNRNRIKNPYNNVVGITV